MATRKPARLSGLEGRRFAVTLGVAFLVVAGLAYWRDHPVSAAVFGALALALLAAGTFAPTRLTPVYALWMSVGHAISKVTTPIILGLVYLLILTPTRLILALFGRHPLRHSVRDGSYWARAESGGRSDLHNQF